MGLDGPWVAVYRSRGGVEIGMSNRRKVYVTAYLLYRDLINSHCIAASWFDRSWLEAYALCAYA